MSMYRRGADPEALTLSATRLRGVRDEAVRVRTVVDRSVASLGTAWGGPDVQRFRADWRADSGALDRVAARLGAMADTLERNAQAQRDASAAGPGGGSGAPGSPTHPTGPTPPAGPTQPAGPTHPPAPGHPDGQQVPPGTFPREATGPAGRPLDRDLWYMAHDAYGDRAGEATNGRPLPPGWSRATPEELDRLGLKDHPAFAGGTKDGLNAAVYKDEHGRYVVAFRGTDSGYDWGVNRDQALGRHTTNFDQAIDIARTVNERTGGNVVFTGHSQGGGLAAAASVATGAPAVTFDASGLHPATAEYAAQLRGMSAEQAMAEANAGNVRAYSVTSDPLTDLQRGTPLPDAVGTRIELPPPTQAQRDAFAAPYAQEYREKGSSLGADLGKRSGIPFADKAGAWLGSRVGETIGREVPGYLYAHHYDPVTIGMEGLYGRP